MSEGKGFTACFCKIPKIGGYFIVQTKKNAKDKELKKVKKCQKKKDIK